MHKLSTISNTTTTVWQQEKQVSLESRCYVMCLCLAPCCRLCENWRIASPCDFRGLRPCVTTILSLFLPWPTEIVGRIVLSVYAYVGLPVRQAGGCKAISSNLWLKNEIWITSVILYDKCSASGNLQPACAAGRVLTYHTFTRCKRIFSPSVNVCWEARFHWSNNLV